jgi:diguanylate cyclase (GGDEF)-like protein/PAS domain S-box-containing protein
MRDQKSRLEQLEKELGLLQTLGNTVVSELNLDRLLPMVADMARELVDASSLVIPIIEQSRDSYTYRAASGNNADRIRGQNFPVGIGMCGWVLTNKKPLIFGEGNEWLMGKRTVWEQGKESALLVPLVARGRIIGGLSGLGKEGGGSFDTRDLDLLTLFANQTSVAIANALIFDELNEKQSELQTLVAKLGYEKEYAQVTLNAISDGVITTDTEARIRTMNPAAQQLLGVDFDHVRGNKIDAVMHFSNEYTRRSIDCPVYAALQDNSMLRLSDGALIRTNHGEEFIAECSASVLQDEHRNRIGGVLIFKDVTDSRRLEREVLFQASHDSLTQLFNRRQFEIRLANALDGARHHGHEHSFCYLDLDQFKIVNDTCGHNAGDQMLVQVAALLKKRIRDRDTLARLGGDEFGLLLENCPLDRAGEIAEQIRRDVETFRFIWEERVFSVGVSIGVVAINGVFSNQAEIFAAADTATFAAKDSGRNRVRVFDLANEDIASRRSDMAWISRLRTALDEEKFICYVQPILAIAEGPQHEIAAYELLLRLKDGTDRALAPNVFLPAAQRFGLMPAIDRWVIRHGLRALKSMGKRDFFLSINLSGASLCEERFLEYVVQEFASAGASFDQVCFEITETAVISNMEKANQFVAELRRLGCLFALDDFGSGMASFGYLKNLPVDILKIDQFFIREITVDPVKETMVRAIQQIANVMDIRTVAEFVQDRAALPKLAEIGVNFAQGYGIAEPFPLSDLADRTRKSG